MSTRLEGAKFRALQTATLRSEYGYDMASLLNSIDDKSSALAVIEGLLENLDNKTTTTPTVAGRVQVEPLGIPTESRPTTATASSTVVNLSPACRRVSVMAVTGPIRYAVAASPANPVATGTSHFVNTGERLDFGVPANGRIAIIRAGTANVQVEISELS